MESQRWDSFNVDELFSSCDLDKSGYIDRNELAAVCDLNDQDLNEIFHQLDLDNDGRISVEEFSKNFQSFSDVVAELKSTKEHGSEFSKSRKGLAAFKNGLGLDSSHFTSQQYISELYYNLTNSNQPDLLDLFEKHLASVVKDIKAKAAENQRLEEALKRTTKQHARQVSNLDREVEQQMEKLEAKVRQEEKSSYDKKLSDFEWQLEGKDKEISAMNKTIETLQSRLDKETNKPNFRREELENAAQENRYLRSQVTDSQTSVALLRSELAELKSQFVEQADQLDKEQRTAQASMQEQENLARQLQLLYEANQRLQDINDELRGSLEERKASSPERKTSCEVLKLSGNLDFSSSLKRSNTFPRNTTPPLVPRLHEYHGQDYNENTLNEDSLFSEIHRASTPYKSDSVDEEDDEAYGTMSKPRKTEVQRQIQILEDTNKRLSSSNDELRVALKLMARSGSFRKPKKTPGSRRNQNSHSDYGSLSSNRSSRSFSPKHKRLSNGDIGDATDESTTYDVEEEEIIGTLADEALEDLIRRYKASELAAGKDEHGHDIEDATNFQNDNQYDNTRESRELNEQEPQNVASEDVTVDRMDYECCLDEDNPSNRRSFESSDEKALNEKSIRTRSKSLELFYIENFANSESCVDGKGDIGGSDDNDGNFRISRETNNEELIQDCELENDHYDHNNREKDGSEDSTADHSSNNNNNVKDNNHSSNNNNAKGLWEITRALNARDRYVSESSLDGLSCIEEEGSLDEDSSEQQEEEPKSDKHEDESEHIIAERTNELESENACVVEQYSDDELANDKGFEKEQFAKTDTTGRRGDEHMSGGKRVQQRLDKNSLSNGRDSEELKNPTLLVKQKLEEERFENRRGDYGEIGETERVDDTGLRFIGFSEEEVSDLDESDWESDEEVDTKGKEEMEKQSGRGDGRREGRGYFNDSREYNADEDDSDEGGDGERVEPEKSWGNDRGKLRVPIYDKDGDDNDGSDYDSSSEDESEYSSDEEMSDLSVEQRQDSTATMNSETIADLESQFNKIKNGKEEGEEKSSKSDADDDEDDEDMDSAELAELVAMASDLTDVTDSESEIAKSESTKTEEISTMTSMTNESLSASYSTPERMYKLVLAGDAAVGKSSFILRLCKNKFHSSLNATLGVDFQVKNLRVDSKTVALQLWDTAGQERFRSIAKSYFRKVDGVLLLYDVTCESSFVNIRDWMSTIEESSQKKVPIMLCGNKCDLRDEYIREGRKVVSRESGQRLAKHYDALFIETSAKDGRHIEDACKELARILTSLENEEIEQSGLKLERKDKEKKKRPCCPS